MSTTVANHFAVTPGGVDLACKESCFASICSSSAVFIYAVDDPWRT